MNEDRILRLPIVLNVTGLYKNQLYDLMANGRFPQSVKIGERSVGWRNSDVQDWIRTRALAYGKKARIKCVPCSDDIPALMADLAKRSGIAPLCLRFIILTACKATEARGARWREIDMQSGVWIMWPRRLNCIPLSEEAIAVLLEAQSMRINDTNYIFQSDNNKMRIDHYAISRELSTLRPGFTIPGLRAAFKAWAEESGRYRTKESSRYRTKAIEASLAYITGDKVEEAYQKTDLLEQRRALMQDWARHCCPVA